MYEKINFFFFFSFPWRKEKRTFLSEEEVEGGPDEERTQKVPAALPLGRPVLGLAGPGGGGG